jgi:hypothetical protein
MRDSCKITTGGSKSENKKVFGGADISGSKGGMRMIKSVLPVMAATLLITVLLVASCGGTPSTTTPITTTTPTTTPPTTTPTTTTPPVAQCKADFVFEIIAQVLDWTTVKFSDESIGDISSWAWDFHGDGVIDSTEQNPTYIYNGPGPFEEGETFEVSLTVTGDNCKDTMTESCYIPFIWD